MAEFPSMPLFTDAYLGDTTHLTTMEHGAYLLLLMTQWRSKDCRLPDDDKMLARYARCNPLEWEAMREILAPFFLIKDGFWVQLRLLDEWNYVRQKREQNIMAGKVSALKRKGRHSTDVTTDVKPEGQHKPNQPTTPNPQPKLNISLTAREDEKRFFLDGTEQTPEMLFEILWHDFPDGTAKGNKAKAKEKFLKLIKAGEDHERIINGARGYRNFCQTEGQFNQHCITWLNQRGWEGEWQPGTGKDKPLGKPSAKSGTGYSLQDAVGQALADKTRRAEGREDRLAALGIGADTGDV